MGYRYYFAGILSSALTTTTIPETLDPISQFFPENFRGNVNFLAEGLDDFFINRIFRENIHIGHWFMLPDSMSTVLGLKAPNPRKRRIYARSAIIFDIPYFTVMVFGFLPSGTIFSKDIFNKPFFNSAPLISTSLAMVKALEKDLLAIP